MDDIIRSKHFTNERSTFRRELFSTGKVKEIEFINSSNFPTILNTETCRVVYDDNHIGDTKITYKDGTVVYRELDKDSLIKLNNPDFAGSIDNNIAYRWRRGKLHTNKMVSGDVPMVHTMGRRGEDLVIVNVKKDPRNVLTNTHGVIMNSAGEWGGLGKIEVKPYEYAISSSIICLITKSENESKELKEYLESDKIKNIVKENQPSFCITKDLFTRIPDFNYE